MFILRCTLSLALLVAASGCSSVSVNHDFDVDAPFPEYKTYAWLPIQQPEGGAGGAQAARTSNDLLDKRIRRAVNAHMEAEGFTLDTENPDILVIYHTGVQDKVNVTDWGYRYGGGYYGWGGRDIDVYQYQEGTLIVDLIDAAQKELVWRASASGTLSDNPSPEKMDDQISKVVGKMFTKYPPTKDS